MAKTKLCNKCGETKPIEQFRRKLTLAQSRAYLKNPDITTRYITQSINCNECRQKMRSTKPLTKAQIRTKITTGDMHPMIGEAKLKEMREQLPKIRSRVMKEYWQGVKRKPLLEIKKQIQQRVAQYANRYHAYKASRSATPTEHALLEQHRLNYEWAKSVRDATYKELESGTLVPKDVDLVSLFTRRKV